MQHEAMITALKSLKLFGMAQAVDELTKQAAPAYNRRRRYWRICSKPRRPNVMCARWPIR